MGGLGITNTDAVAGAAVPPAGHGHSIGGPPDEDTTSCTNPQVNAQP